LGDEGCAEQRIRNAVADPEGRFGDELFEHQLFDGIVKEPPTHAHGRLVWPPVSLASAPSFQLGLQFKPMRGAKAL